jgi:hypothetical protein
MGLRVDTIAARDVRHPHAIAWLKATGGTILHLEPPTNSLFGEQTRHIAETACPAARP